MLVDGTYLVKPDGSIENYGEKWAYGFFVGDGSRGIRLEPGIENEVAVQAIAMLNPGPGIYVGVWTDPETKICCVDPVDHVSDYHYAYRLAAQRNEIAFWDAFKGECIHVEIPEYV